MNNHSQITTVIKCVITSHPEEVKLQDLNKFYLDVENRDIPWEDLGYKSLREFVEALGFVVERNVLTKQLVVKNSRSICKSSHIQEMVKKTKISDKLFRMKRENLFVDIEIQLKILKLINNQPGLCMNDIIREIDKTLPGYCKVQTMYGTAERLFFKMKHLTSVRNDRVFPKTHDYPENIQTYGVGEDTNDKIVSLITNQTKTILLQILCRESQGVWCRHLPNLFEQECGSPLDYHTMGYCGLVLMLIGCPAFRIERLDELDWRVYDATKPPPPGVLEREVGNVKLLLTKHYPAGLNIKHFENVYEEVFKIDFAYKAMQFPSLMHAMHSLIPSGIEVLMIGNKPIVKLLMPLKIPDNTFTYEGRIPIATLAPKVKPHEWMNIMILDVCTPTLFFARMDTSQDLLKLSAAMQKMYDNNLTMFAIPGRRLVANMHCVVYFKNYPHRGLTLSPITYQKVVVFLIDFGRWIIVPMGAVLYMHKAIATLPAQAILCNLYNVVPFGTKKRFSTECCAQFFRMCNVELTECFITDIHNEDRALSMLLAVTSDDGIVFPDQKLRQEKLVSFTDSTPPRLPELWDVWMAYVHNTKNNLNWRDPYFENA